MGASSLLTIWLFHREFFFFFLFFIFFFFLAVMAFGARPAFPWRAHTHGKQSCRHFVLDTGLHMALAQRFYFRQGLLAHSMGFSETLFDADGGVAVT
jgi:hypothetical protein